MHPLFFPRTVLFLLPPVCRHSSTLISDWSTWLLFYFLSFLQLSFLMLISILITFSVLTSKFHFTSSIKAFISFLFLSPIDLAIPVTQLMSHVILASLRWSISRRPTADCSIKPTFYFTTFHLAVCIWMPLILPCLIEKSPLLYQIRIVYNIIDKSTFLHIQVMDFMNRVPSFVTLYTRTVSILLSKFIVLSCVYNSFAIF